MSSFVNHRSQDSKLIKIKNKVKAVKHKAPRFGAQASNSTVLRRFCLAQRLHGFDPWHSSSPQNVLEVSEHRSTSNP